MLHRSLIWLAAVCLVSSAAAEVGDPQIRTDHPWYPGELAISNFDRLFQTQAETYRRVTGIDPSSEPGRADEHKALASWLWRNTHYWHGEVGKRDWWGEGFQRGRDMRAREYWNGLFAFGFGLCGTTHSQWTAEFEQLFGHGRARGVGAAGHNAFEVFLTGDAYGPAGRWALLDHDLSTVIFDRDGRRLLGLGEIQADVDRWIDRDFMPEKQRGWLVCGLYPGDGESYRSYNVAEYLPGYAGPPPMVNLRRGETMRRYFRPGLEDGNTFVFWGRNDNSGGIPGPQRSRTWVNQPERMFGSKTGTAHVEGQARYANVEYVYRPDFRSGDYREAVVREGDGEIVFDFRTPYIIAATPPDDSAWGIYEDGCRNGLVVSCQTPCEVSISTDAGKTWSQPRTIESSVDLTDRVKGRGQYWIRFASTAERLADSDLEIRTVCQANVAVLPRLKDNGTTVTYACGEKTVLPIGPEWDLATAHVVDGGFDQNSVTLRAVPGKDVVGIHAAAHVASGNPPNPSINYSIEYSDDVGEHWQPMVTGWNIARRGDEPGDFWSQSFCYGSWEVDLPASKPVRIRFRNNGGKRCLRAEAHLVLDTGPADPLRVTYKWSDSQGEHRQSHTFLGEGRWQLPTAENVQTRWVEFQPVASR
jgi:hypothetical protein